MCATTELKNNSVSLTIVVDLKCDMNWESSGNIPWMYIHFMVINEKITICEFEMMLRFSAAL